jgi:ATP-dependent DNA ligase
MDPLQFRRPAPLVYLPMREKGREIIRHGLAAVPPSQHCGTRLWARATSDYSKAFTRIGDAVAALPVESAVLDGEAIVMRSADGCDFEALRSREGQAEAILVAYEVMEVDAQDVRPEPLEEPA